MLGHLEDGFDGLALGGLDEAASVDDQDIGVLGLGDDLPAAAGKRAKHHFAVHQILGTAETHYSDLRHCGPCSEDADTASAPRSGVSLRGSKPIAYFTMILGLTGITAKP